MKPESKDIAGRNRCHTVGEGGVERCRALHEVSCYCEAVGDEE